MLTHPQLPDKWVKLNRRNCSVSQAARWTIAGRLDAVEALVPLAAEKAHEDIEYVHSLRVWSRRASTAIELFEDHISSRPARRVLKRLKQIRRSANDARNCDVSIARLTKSIRRSQERLKSDCEPNSFKRQKQKLKREQRWLKDLMQQRKEGQQAILTRYKKLVRNDELNNLFGKLISKITERPSPDAQNFHGWATDQLQQQAKAFFAEFPEEISDIEALHQFRIQSKTFRYALEVLAAALDQDTVQTIYGTLTKLQNQLGRINDLSMLCQQLKERANDSRNANDERMLLKLRKRKKRRLKHEVAVLDSSINEAYLIPIKAALSKKDCVDGDHEGK